MRAWSFTMWAADTPMAKHARQAVRDGFAVVFLRPGGKEPICPLTAREAKKIGTKHPCGVAHASTDEKWVVRTAMRLEREHGRINIGIAAHASRVVVIDADTTEQVESVRELLRLMGAVEELYGMQPTVSTPGVLRDGVRVHEGGMHWYFNRPDGLDLPEYPGQIALAGGAVMRWGNTYTVVPPSERPEGRYMSLAEVIPDVPIGLAMVIHDYVMRRQHAAAEAMSHYTNDPVVEWSVTTQWHELLEPDGWQYLGKLDHQCGCPVWRRPGDGQTSNRSAIAHENDCQHRENREGHGSLHVFSDNVPGPVGERVSEGVRDFTKLQFVALVSFEGDETAAQIALGLTPNYEEMWSGSASSASDEPPNASAGQQQNATSEETASDQGKQADEAEHPMKTRAKRIAARTGVSLAAAMKAVGDQWLAREVRAELDEEMGGIGIRDGSSWLPVDIESLLSAFDAPAVATTDGALLRSDGAPLFSFGRMHQLFGQSEAGKTWLMFVAMIQLARRGMRSLFCDFEDNMTNFVKRFRDDLGIDIRPWIADGTICYANPTEPPTDMQPLLNEKYALVVVDSLSEVVASVANGQMTDGVLLRRVLRKFRELADAGASVVIIAHGSEKVDVPTTSLGASEIRQAMTGQDILLTNHHPFGKGLSGGSYIYVAKDRASETSADIDVDQTALSKALKRLWGEMKVTGLPHDPPRVGWYTSIDIEPAEHKVKEPKERKIDIAERLVIVYLRDAKGQEARQIRLIDDIADENDIADRTIRRAIDRLLEAEMIHEVMTAPEGVGRPSPLLHWGPPG